MKRHVEFDFTAGSVLLSIRPFDLIFLLALFSPPRPPLQVNQDIHPPYVLTYNDHCVFHTFVVFNPKFSQVHDGTQN
jgi:hypothetical protein